MNLLIWIIFIFLILPLLYVAYRLIIRRLLALKRQASSRASAKSPKTDSRQPSVYSYSKDSLPSPSDKIHKRTPPPSTSTTPSRTPPKSPSTSPRPQTRTFPALESQLQELARIAWTTEQSFQHSKFLLSKQDFVNITTPAQAVEALLRHAARKTPGFQVPVMVPRVLVTSVPFAAGTFEEDEEGWVTIKLNSDFFQDRLAAQAILAHEVCHYILSNSGIRKSDFELNERYTDLCMFICGFGEIFLSGYKRESAQKNYRPGHRLGYLTDAEYRFAYQYVLKLRQSDALKPPSDLNLLEKRLLSLVYGDKSVCHRLLEAERQRSPHKTEEEIYRDAIYWLEKDRR